MNIALISEGITDQPVITAVLNAFCEQHLPGQVPNINLLHPRQKEPGGWVKVFNYCTTAAFQEALTFNDYIIVQIDTDRHQDKGYEVANGKSVQSLITGVQNKLIEKMGQGFYAENANKILFAVCVDMIECWLLPFYATTEIHRKKATGCCNTVNQYLKKQGYTLDCKNDAGGYAEYAKAAKGFAKKKDFFPLYKKNESLRQFVDVELAKIIQR